MFSLSIKNIFTSPEIYKEVRDGKNIAKKRLPLKPLVSPQNLCKSQPWLTTLSPLKKKRCNMHSFNIQQCSKLLQFSSFFAPHLHLHQSKHHQSFLFNFQHLLLWKTRPPPTTFKSFHVATTTAATWNKLKFN